MKLSELIKEKISLALSMLTTTVYTANDKDNFDKQMETIHDLITQYERVLEMEKKYLVNEG